MDVLKAEMARKRKQLEKAEAVADGRKFFRRGDLAARQQEEYWAKYYAKHGKEEVAPDPETSEPKEEEEETSALAPLEVRRRLRERAQPIRLFAETDLEARRRLRRLELDAPELKEGWRNEFQSALNKVDEDFMKEVIAGSVGEEGRHDVKVEESLGEINMIRDRIKNKLGQTDDPAADCQTIYDFYNYLLQRWGRTLNARDEQKKRSGQGKIDSAIHTQTTENLKPLFGKLLSRSIASDIREHLVAITIIMSEGDYVRANNAYMEMAIGNAPWPVGVTRSGLHQRPGSAKMYVKNIAHVLNDETQRKYIQGLKRLMTKCQAYFPSDPSRCIDYVSPKDREDE